MVICRSPCTLSLPSLICKFLKTGMTVSTCSPSTKDYLGVPIHKTKGIKYSQSNITFIGSILLLFWLGSQTYGLLCNGNKDSPDSYYWHMRQDKLICFPLAAGGICGAGSTGTEQENHKVKDIVREGKGNTVNWDWKQSFASNWTEIREALVSGRTAEILLKMQKTS